MAKLDSRVSRHLSNLKSFFKMRKMGSKNTNDAGVKLRMSWANRITIGRILLIVPFVALMLHLNDSAVGSRVRYVALAFFLVMALSDALDGYLARRSDDVTALGTFLDPLADKLLITCSCLLLCWEKTAVEGMRLPDVVVVFIIGKDLYITLGFLIIFYITSEINIEPGRMGKLCTALQLVMIAGILISPDVQKIWQNFKYVVMTIWWAATGASILAVIQYTRAGTRFMNKYEQDKIAKGS
ncbi:MAG: CDP-alcohol phosphatidyltransferase family protein [Phycisphaerae bacterium]|nr:CDP-alcohol phosphatidyltransferase family protein [Phycisphaerae bacterium]